MSTAKPDKRFDNIINSLSTDNTKDVLMFIKYRDLILDEVRSFLNPRRLSKLHYAQTIQDIGGDVDVVVEAKIFINTHLLTLLQIDEIKFEQSLDNVKLNNYLVTKDDLINYILKVNINTGVHTKTFETEDGIKLLVFIPGIKNINNNNNECIKVDSNEKYIYVHIKEENFNYIRTSLVERIPFPSNVKDFEKYSYENGIIEFMFTTSPPPPPPPPPGPPGPPGSRTVRVK